MRQNSDFLCDRLSLIFDRQDNCSTHFLETVFSILILKHFPSHRNTKDRSNHISGITKLCFDL